MSKNLKEYVVIICAAIVLTLLINKFLLFKIVVPTPSMSPTIEPEINFLLQEYIIYLRSVSYTHLTNSFLICRTLT